jgi:hypothetical protein
VFGPLSVLATAACLASPVSADRSSIQVGPFKGGLAAGYDDVNGRFSLRVGGMRTTQMSSKILWLLPDSYRDVGALIVTGRRIGGGRFTQTFTEAGASTPPNMRFFPSIINPPATGCWRLWFQLGELRASALMLARPRPSG